MRNIILQKMADQDRAWQANSDLLTSMTHDIRTPLTTLLGYMEILGGENANLTDEQKTYVRVCTQKAEQIKELSDKLFLYFWAFNRAETENASDFETYEAGLLFEQLIGDCIPAMEAVGLRVTADLSAISPSDTLRVRIDCLHRVTDNVFDNMTKYADRAHPVTITAERRGDRLIISFRNTVNTSRETPTGTRIGVKTCVNMMEMMKGSFETHTDGDTFTASLSLPLHHSRA
jgi:K+-sensing histidine kinase KdpD